MDKNLMDISKLEKETPFLRSLLLENSKLIRSYYILEHNNLEEKLNEFLSEITYLIISLTYFDEEFDLYDRRRFFYQFIRYRLIYHILPSHLEDKFMTDIMTHVSIK